MAGFGGGEDGGKNRLAVIDGKHDGVAERAGVTGAVLAAAASRAFGLLEPSLGDYGIRPGR
jgi:hypothetical protein